MAKRRTIYICSDCGGASPAWSGRCPHCSEWDTLIEEVVGKIPGKASALKITENTKPVSITGIKKESGERLNTGIDELDRVLGGGVLRGSVNLVGGQPGIGKSTLMLQLAHKLAANNEKVLYVSGEESPGQVAGRAKRINSLHSGISILSASSLDNILLNIETGAFSIVIIDSIQTLLSPDLSSAPGSVAQVRHCASELVRYAKFNGLTLFIIGHVTKSGSLAGTKVLEHLVDAVIYFEGNDEHTYRLLRCIKNRYGSTNELGVFEMTAKGLVDVRDASAYFLRREGAGNPGTVITAVMEGTRPFLVEVQALTSTTRYGYPQRSVNGMDSRRLPMLLAVLEKRCGITLEEQDVYVNVAGGMSLADPGADLGVCLAVASSRLDRSVRSGVVVAGEVGLGGELRPVSHFNQRLNEVQSLGFTTLAGALENTEPAGKGAEGYSDLFQLIKSILSEKTEHGGNWL